MNWRDQIRRPALGLKVGGFKPTGNPCTTVFGDVRVQRAGEAWPTWKNKPLWPLCQLNLTEAAFMPAGLQDLAMVSVFIAEDYIESDALIVDAADPEPGWAWFLRTYQTLDGLETISAASKPDSPLQPFEARWAPETREDYPTQDTLPIDFEALGLGDYYAQDGIERLNGTKLGGWPSCIQSEPWWNHDPQGSEFEYVLQIDSEPKSGWMWGDSGNGFFARSNENPNRWALDFQFF
ncbi:DUF1963 domain-containing protein [Roseibium sediminicola]|uniref:YwqG family protein n=1 Tax=Roseibium sediminicola TaxID=2933272 RepID=A0ABT0GRD6_9HYPH|nr:DUF1963 domain-containing protein [Roseibium sp. CAU 1639]MCK7611607.1 YwqG family protein [Roseibium sp. CAU 1639]